MAKYREVQPLSAIDAAYIAGLVDGEGTITLSRKHAGEGRQLVVSISNTERSIVEFALGRIALLLASADRALLALVPTPSGSPRAKALRSAYPAQRQVLVGDLGG